jgi:hypothetical protein
MKVITSITNDGLNLKITKSFRIRYPLAAWNSLGKIGQTAFADSLTYLKISPYAAILKDEYFLDTRKPIGLSQYNKCAKEDFVRFGFEDKKTPELLQQNFNSAKFHFNQEESTIPEIDGDSDPKKALLAISFGKESLLSFGLMRELGVKTDLVYFENTWDAESFHQMRILKEFEKEFNIKGNIVVDECDEFDSDSYFKGIVSKGVYGSNAMNSYMMLALPIALQGKAGSLAFGNEQNFNDKFKDREGREGYVSFEQSSLGMKVQNQILSRFTGGKVKLASYVEPLYQIAEMKILLNRYPAIAKHLMSCSHKDVENMDNRWCHACDSCSLMHLFISAIGKDPAQFGFKLNFFDKSFEKYDDLLYDDLDSLDSIYERKKKERDQVLFAYYLAYRNGAKGYLIDKFRKTLLKEAIEREDELYDIFFRIYPSTTLPKKIVLDLKSIFHEELAK